MRLQLLAELAFERGDQIGQGRALERERTGDLDVGGAFAGIPQHMELRGNFRQQRKTLVGDQQANQFLRFMRHRRFQRRQEDPRHIGFGELRIIGDCLHVGHGGDLPHLRHELRPCTQIAGLRHAEQRLCVRTGNGCEFCHDYSSALS